VAVPTGATCGLISRAGRLDVECISSAAEGDVVPIPTWLKK